MSDGGVIGCGGSTYAGSFIRDHNGFYALHVTGELTQLNEVTDKAYAYYESVKPRRGWGGITLYKDNQHIYFFNNTVKDSGSFEKLFGGDTKTFEPYAGFEKLVVFRDKTGIYFPKASWKEDELIRIVDHEAQMVCMEEEYLCLLRRNTLYYVFGDRTIKQVQVDGDRLGCISQEKALSVPLSSYMAKGGCFDYRYFYDQKGERYAINSDKYYELRPYVIKTKELEQKRLDSLEKVSIKQEPLLMDEKPESDDFERWYVM